MRRYGLFLASMLMAIGSHAQTAPVNLYAAGSLRDALTEVVRLYEAQGGPKVALTFGSSGLLRERMEQGESAQLFT